MDKNFALKTLKNTYLWCSWYFYYFKGTYSWFWHVEKVLKIVLKEPCYPHQGSALDPLESTQQPSRPQAAIYTPYVHYWDTKEISFCYFGNTKLCANYCWDHVCKLNEWCIVNCFHCKFRVSTQIMVCDYCITKCKKFSACGWLLMTFRAIFFTIQNFTLIWAVTS